MLDIGNRNGTVGAAQAMTRPLSTIRAYPQCARIYSGIYAIRQMTDASLDLSRPDLIAADLGGFATQSAGQERDKEMGGGGAGPSRVVVWG